MFGGDEVGAMVVDIGSCTSRFGFAGEDAPKCVFDTAVGSSLHESVKKSYVGHQIYPREGMDIISPIQHGMIENWDAMEKLWEYGLQTHLHADPAEHPMMVAEPSYADTQTREKMITMLFEKFQVPAVFLAKDAVLTAFSLGKSSALVVDSGAGKTSVTPVCDGFVLKRSTRRTKIAGQFVDMVLERELFINKQKSVQPNYMFDRKWIIDDSKAGGKIQVTPTNLNTTSSYHQYACLKMIRDIKASICQLSIDSKIDISAQIPDAIYELPDGTTLNVGMERFTVTEPLFTSHGIEMESDLSDYKFEGLPSMVRSSMASCDIDLHKDLYGTIILSGGTTAFHRFSSRLSRALEDQSFKVRIVNGSEHTRTDRVNSVWLGGSILGSLGSFHQMWVSKAEFEEHGASIIAQRCP